MAVTHQPKATGDAAPAGIYDHDGTFYATVRRVVRVAGPASYTTGGFLVDLSAMFSRIICAKGTRVFVTATGLAEGSKLPAQVSDPGGASGFLVGKFLALLNGGVGSHTHTYDRANSPTGGPSGAPTGLGGDNAHTHGLTYTATASGSGSSSIVSQRGAGSNESNLTFEFEVEGVPA